jgi:hypothetical protein
VTAVDHAGRRRSRFKVTAVILVIAVVAGAFALVARSQLEEFINSLTASSPSGQVFGSGPVRIALFGDSLVTQSAPAFTQVVTSHGRATLRVIDFPGTAICDWWRQLEAVAAWRPRAVVMEFSGDNLTPCTRDPRTGRPRSGAPLIDAYRSDAERAMHILEDTTVYWVGAPPDRDPANSAVAEAVRAIYAGLPPRYHNARFVDAGQAVTSRGRYVDILPCLSFEPCPRNGYAQVRSPDGIHFCPVEARGNGVCPVWSSGAYRFGVAMAAPVVHDLGL